jgi:ATP-dependent DNA helicase PIF1
LRFYLGHDSIEEDEKLKDKRDRAIYTPEHMAKLQPGNLPPRDLFLKFGSLVILLKILNIAKGLCNGTRMIVTDLKEHVIVCKVITGASNGEVIFINRMLNKSNQNLPVTMVRRQFPLSLAYSLSIDKSQGQTINQIGMYLPKPCFSHGQFYVGLSRVSKFTSVKCAIDTTDQHGYQTDQSTGKLDKSKIYTANVVLRSIFDNS